MVKLSVLLPTWQNKEIIWLAMEGLCRQVDSPDWELIIFECEKDCGIEHFKQWSERLYKAGCKQVLYMHSPERLSLSRKWKLMFEQAKGEFVALQGSDDYPHPERNQLAVRMDADWYDCMYYYQYHVQMKKLIQYAGWKGKTGFNMVIRAKLVKNIPACDLPNCIDSFLYRYAKPEKVIHDDRIFAGVSTTGHNTISTRRDMFFRNVKAPFRPTKKTLDKIGLPADIVKRLKEMR